MKTTRMRPPRNTFPVALWLGLAALLLRAPALPAEDAAPQACGRLENGYGPYDYLNPSDVSDKLPIVERYHFDQDTEALVKGPTSDDPGVDLDYVLRTFPNHHRALYAMARYHWENRRWANARYYTAECYFDRAKRFRPKDPTVYLIHGIYLERMKDPPGAMKQYGKAIELNPNYAEAHYNLGLLYFKSGDYEAARASAQKAYELGHPLPGLKRMLVASGHWSTE